MENKIKSNVVRFLDKKNNKSLIQFNDEYDENGILKKITFNFIGVDSSSGQFQEQIFDFNNLTINNQKPQLENEKIETKEDLKEYILKCFNQNKNMTLVCPKEDCKDPNCKPHLSIGNKIISATGTKKPYFSSDCNGINYGESFEHLNTKINIYKYLMDKRAYYEKKQGTTKVKVVEIEKVFSIGNGQERRADVYYEKEYSTKEGKIVTEKYAIEVQRSNIKYGELKIRTDWYKQNDIATFWIVVANTFNNDKEIIDKLSKDDFKVPLLSLISFSMNKYNDRFFIYDEGLKKIIPLTLQQENIENFNEQPKLQNKFKSKFQTNNLYIISKNKIDDKHYELLPYKENRCNTNIGLDLVQNFGCFKNKYIFQKCWNENTKKYEIVSFEKINNIQKKQPIKKNKI